MKIGIHHKLGSFSERWTEYCDGKGIPWKQVDCYRNDILQQLNDCDALMWHINQNNPKELLFAKQLIFSVLATGKRVFPDYSTAWHFDDKVGQKYLLEAVGAPIPDTWIFYDKENAYKWAANANFPVVFKLRRGSGSQNVRIVKKKQEAIKFIRIAFGKGFSTYYAKGNLKERWRKYKAGHTVISDLFEGVARFLIPPPYASILGREKGYVYFQEFKPENNFDIRTIVIGNRAFAIKRLVRKNDFRASGSGLILYEREHFDAETIRLSFEIAEKLKSQCTAFDFVYSRGKPFVLEISFGFVKEGYDPCPGYWDRDLNWHEGKFDHCGWMVENLIEEIRKVGSLTL